MGIPILYWTFSHPFPQDYDLCVESDIEIRDIHDSEPNSSDESWHPLPKKRRVYVSPNSDSSSDSPAGDFLEEPMEDRQQDEQHIGEQVREGSGLPGLYSPAQQGYENEMEEVEEEVAEKKGAGKEEACKEEAQKKEVAEKEEAGKEEAGMEEAGKEETQNEAIEKEEVDKEEAEKAEAEKERGKEKEGEEKEGEEKESEEMESNGGYDGERLEVVGEIANEGTVDRASNDAEKIVREKVNELKEKEKQLENLRLQIETLKKEVSSQHQLMEDDQMLRTEVSNQGQQGGSVRCGECNASYKNFSSLKKHYKNRHEGKIPEKQGSFECDKCGKVFREKQILVAHVKTVHQEKPACPTCGKKQSNLQRHLKSCNRKHKEKTACGKDFQEREPLRKGEDDNLQEENLHEDQFERDTQRAMKASRAEDPDILPASEVKAVAVKFASELGLKTKGALQHIELDGNCLPTATSLALNPESKGQALKTDAWELRVKSLGIAVNMVHQLGLEDMQMLQALAAGETNIAFSADDIKMMLEEYQQTGVWNGPLGDVLGQIISSFIRRPIVIIEVKQKKAVRAVILYPGKIFYMGEETKDAVPVVLVSQADHFNVLHLVEPEEAAAVYQTWKANGIEFIPAQHSEEEEAGSVRQTEQGNNRSSEGKGHMTPKRKLYNPKEHLTPQVFSPADEDRQEENQTGDNTRNEVGTDQVSSESQGAAVSRQESIKKGRVKFDRAVTSTLTAREQGHFYKLREDLDKAFEELPDLQEQLKECRKGDETLVKLVEDYKLTQDGKQHICEVEVEKFGEKSNRTPVLMVSQLREKILPFLHKKYPGMDVTILLDFAQEKSHKNYISSEPSTTTKLHWFTSGDILECVNNSFKSLPHPGPSRLQLILAWQTLSRAIAWLAKEKKNHFSDRGLATDTISHYQEAAESLAPGIKYYKSLQANKKAEDQMHGKSNPELAAISKAVTRWYQSEERKAAMALLDDLVTTGGIATANQYNQLEEALHNDLVMSTPFRNIVWSQFPYRALVECFKNPGWDPADIAGRDSGDIVTIEEDGLELTLCTDISRPPPGRACEHQKENPMCNCPNACRPTGFNTILTWDKGSSGKNRYLHLPLHIYEQFDKFCQVRNRHFASVMKNGPSGTEGEDWFKGHCPVLLSRAGKKKTAFTMTLASKVAGQKVTPHMFRKLYCTYLARHQERAVRDAQSRVCGHSTPVYQEFYDMGTRKDAQYLIQKVMSLQSEERSEQEPEAMQDSSQERVDEELERMRKINEKVLEQEEDVDNHNFYQPILKEHLKALVTAGTRMRLSFLTSHPDFDAQARDMVGDKRLSKEEWMRKLAAISCQDTPAGHTLRKILVDIFKGREDLQRHKWSVRESMAVRQAKAKERRNLDSHLEDPLWTLLDTLYRSIKSKLVIAAGRGLGGNFGQCLCQELSSSAVCIHCQKAVCDRCCR